MKKAFSILLVLCLIIGLSACSGSSDIGESGQNLADNAGSCNWLEGARFGGDASEDEILSWIEKLH